MRGPLEQLRTRVSFPMCTADRVLRGCLPPPWPRDAAAMTTSRRRTRTSTCSPPFCRALTSSSLSRQAPLLHHHPRLTSAGHAYATHSSHPPPASRSKLRASPSLSLSSRITSSCTMLPVSPTGHARARHGHRSSRAGQPPPGCGGHPRRAGGHRCGGRGQPGGAGETAAAVRPHCPWPVLRWLSRTHPAFCAVGRPP